MSLITRCPACGTMFKVVPDQLRISEGWVRCGKCAEIFDASQRLEGGDVVMAAAQERAAPPPPLAPPQASAAAAQRTEPAPLTPSEPEGFSSSLHTDINDDDLPELLDSVHFDDEAHALVEHPLDRPFELKRADAGEVTGRRQDQPRRARPQPEPEPEDEHEDLSFVRQARSDTARLGPATRVLFLLVLIVLALLLAGQLVIYDRDRLAASDPALARLVANLCAPLSCTAQVPRQIDAIVIDSSSFNRLRGEAYRLNVTLKNQALIDVALPALELTLTDGQDQALVRRVFMPSELGMRPVIAASSDWSGSLALALSDNSGSRIAGYRLLAFYP